MVSTTTSTTDFYQVYEDLQKQHSPQWLTRLRRSGIEGFTSTGFPTRKHEEYKYTDVTSLQEQRFHRSAHTGDISPTLLEQIVPAEAVCLVFVDGRFAAGLSRWQDVKEKLEFRPVSEMLSQEHTLHQGLGRADQVVIDPFAGLNQALFEDGALIRVQPNVAVKQPIFVVSLFTGDRDNVMAFPRHGLSIGSGAEVDIVEMSLGVTPQTGYFHNAQTNLLIDANACVRYTQIQTDGAAAYHVHNTHVQVERDSQVDLLTLTVGGKLVRNNLEAVLNGSGIDMTLNGLYAVRAEQHVDNHTSIDHRAPHSRSSQLYKGLLSGRGRTVFNGKIFVQPEAQQTNAYQLNRNLLLSQETEADTKPQLEIYADDVRCTHGATVGSINDDELFYLESRGVAHDQAVSLLSHGFVENVLTGVDDENLQTRLRAILNDYFTAIEGSEA